MIRIALICCTALVLVGTVPMPASARNENLAEQGQPGPEIIAALRKRFSDFESVDSVIYNSASRYEVTFYTKKGHMLCQFTPPAKLRKCRFIHA